MLIVVILLLCTTVLFTLLPQTLYSYTKNLYQSKCLSNLKSLVTFLDITLEIYIFLMIHLIDT